MERRPIRDLALFAGAGGGILGGLAVGHRTVCAVEIAEYPRRVLLARQRDGVLPRFPIWDDVRTFDGRPWRGHVDVVSGGFPCQDISQNTTIGGRPGLAGSRSGLWSEYARIVDEVRPRFVWIENSPHLRIRGLDVVLSDLAALRYHAEWGVLGAADVGGPHVRDRLWILAHTDDEIDGVCTLHEALAATPELAGHATWPGAPSDPRVAYGVAARMDRIRSTGNGQVARVAAVAWTRLLRRAAAARGLNLEPPPLDR